MLRRKRTIDAALLVRGNEICICQDDFYGRVRRNCERPIALHSSGEGDDPGTAVTPLVSYRREHNSDLPALHKSRSRHSNLCTDVPCRPH